MLQPEQRRAEACIIRVKINLEITKIMLTFVLRNQNKRDMKKIYILTCVNENSDVVSVKTYKSESEAKADMEAQYYAELRNAENSGFEIDDYFSGVEGKTAGILYGETQYKWQVHEAFDPVAEDAEADKMKDGYIEQVYFYVRASFEDDTNQRLMRPVDGYTSFYFDGGSETIQVWHAERRNYTSIFNIPTDTAYEIAKMIDDGFYEPEDE